MIEPPPPVLDLTLALVGKRRIDPADLVGMTADLTLAFDAVAGGLRAVAQAGGARLTLITGLADGADQIASALFLSNSPGAVARVLRAILPCPVAEFARNSPVEDLATFERAAQSCAFITVLPGSLLPPPPEELNTDIARQARRARSDIFAAQADALLKDADILVAIDDPDDEGDIGGTRHTLHRALNRGLPVILIHLGRDGVRLPRPGSPIDQDEHLRGDRARIALVGLVKAATTATRSAKA